MATGGLIEHKQRILKQHFLELRTEILRGHLKQTDRLLQLRRQREVLRQLELQGLFHRVFFNSKAGNSRLNTPGEHFR